MVMNQMQIVQLVIRINPGMQCIQLQTVGKNDVQKR
jgi:hypothetical protein